MEASCGTTPYAFAMTPAVATRRPRLRVAHKLFLLLALVIALSLGALSAWTVINLRRGFVHYVNELDLQRLAPLAQTLGQRSDATEGFPGLRGPGQWPDLLRVALGPPHPPPPPPSERPSPPRPSTSALPPVPLPPRVSLLDAQHQLLAGPPVAAHALERLILHNGVLVGWLSLRPLTRPADTRDSGFLAAQIHALVILAIVLLLLALAVAWIFAKHLLAPLREVERVAGRLAGGDYGTRIASERRDEFGDLVRHIDQLAISLAAHEGARRRWIADISHELRTPLSIVRGEVEAMQDGVRKIDRGGLASLHEEVMRLDRLVNDLHELSLADLGALSYRPRKVDLAELLRETCARFRAKAEAAGLRLQIDVPDAPRFVTADPDRITQLLSNLLVNCVRYTDRGGTIRVVLGSGKDDSVCVCVEDSAPGVDDKARAHLFEPLFRAESSRDRRRGGSGLGLAIAQRIAEAHGGRLLALPSVLGGLRIELWLPTAKV